jgi:cytochrome d ubiquinol oxidase subunit II
MLLKDTYVYDATSKVVNIESMKLLHTLLDNPILFILLIVGIVLFLYSIFIALFKNNQKAVWYYGFGIVIIVTILLFIVGIEHTIFYPSLSNIQSSLHIERASGSYYTLSVMSVVSLLVPVVLSYIFLVWRSMDKTKMTIEEVKSDHHHY